MADVARSSAPVVIRRSFKIEALALYLVIAGVLSLLGWVFDIRRLTDWDDNGISIQPNACVAVTLTGGALLLLQFGYRRAALTFGSCVLMIGATVGLQYATGLSFGIDTLLMFDRTWGRLGVLSPGRMGPPAAISWTLLGLAIIAASYGETRPRRAAAGLALVTACISALSLVGYLYGSSALYSLPRFTVIALQTASFILAASMALILAIPESGPMRFLSSSTAGGVLARRLLPALVLFPLLFGLVGVRMDELRVDAAFSSGVRTIAEIIALGLLLWFGATAVDKHANAQLEAERARRASDRRVIEILENITDAFVAVDPQWRYVYVNAEAEHLLGKSREELLGKVAWAVFPETVGTGAHSELQRAAAERRRTEFEAYNPLKKRWYSNKAYPMPDGNLAVFFEDISTRRFAEEAAMASRKQLELELDDTRTLQAISTELVGAEDSPQFYDKLLDAAARIMRADFASLQTLHRNDAGEALYLLAHRGFTREAAASWEWVGCASATSCAAALRKGCRVVVPDIGDCAFLPGTLDATPYKDVGIAAVQSTPLVSRSGSMLGMISTHWRKKHAPEERELRLFDILARQAADWIERRQSERQTEKLLAAESAARAQSEREARLKDEFLATLSHELRTPLTAIMGWAQILKKDPSNRERICAAADVIERNGRAQIQLITDLLDISRIVAGTMRLDVQAVDLAGIIDASMEAVLPAATAKELRIEKVVEVLNHPIYGDPARLQQMLWNLLSNAVKFTPRGGCIEVVLARTEETVQLRVIDSGAGISPEFLPHVFDRFRQGDSSTARQHGGLGLGLAIVKQFTELHGGSICARSEGLGRGATFEIELPLSKLAFALGVGPPEPGPSVTESFDGRSTLEGIRALVVDDDPDTLLLIRDILAECGARVGTANSAGTALTLVAEDRFDIIVSDVGMPGSDGYEMVAELRRRGIQTPAIALTAFARLEDRKRALQSGFQAHVTKPLESGQLLREVARLTAPDRRD